MQEIFLSADELVSALLKISENEQICLLDSCNVSHLGSHLLLAGIKPLETFEITDENCYKTLEFLNNKLENEKTFAFFTISYDFGLKLNKITSRKKQFTHTEPDIYLAIFDTIIIHDYNTKKTYLKGNETNFKTIETQLLKHINSTNSINSTSSTNSKVSSNFTRAEYLEKIEEIKEFIRKGDTYQTNFTQQFTAELPEKLTPQKIFQNLRTTHPAPFASFIKRNDSFVISASPERFFKVDSGKLIVDSKETQKNYQLSTINYQLISTSPIKGTRPRGKNLIEDEKLRYELLNSEKDRAENVMIVDLLRNDIGRICDFGSVTVEKLCDLEEHPTLFHLTSTINGTLRENLKFSDILQAVFPCGSITGAPKIRTMQIIDQLETANRGLSMGAIGFASGKLIVDSGKLSSQTINYQLSNINLIDASVAIRTMVIKDNRATFNVGGGIVIDSIPENEYEESLTKAKALMNSINGRL